MPHPARRTTSTGATSNRVRAFLAAGLVLGVGAVVTLASWTSTEVATRSFTSGTFALEGTADGSTWSSNPVGTPLTFSPTVSNMSPNTSYPFPFAVRLSAATTANATGALVAPVISTGGNDANLAVAVYSEPSFGCPATATLAAQTPLTSASTFALTAQAGATPPSVSYFCFVVSAGGTLEGATTNTITWEFDATSD